MVLIYIALLSLFQPLSKFDDGRETKIGLDFGDCVGLFVGFSCDNIVMVILFVLLVGVRK